MRTSIDRSWSLAVLVALFLLMQGCAAKSPEEQVAELRSGYEATLNGFVVVQEPLMTEEVPVDDETVATEEEATEEGDVDAEPAPVEVRQDVKLDIMIYNSNYEKLPGLTLDVSQGTAAGEKNHWRIWVDTADLGKGSRQAYVHTLEDIDHVEGDGYAVEVRASVPVEERGEYREFSP
ncbi:MAG: hypothetical protein AAF604_04245 [Acidobacteriota bacterium]